MKIDIRYSCLGWTNSSIFRYIAEENIMNTFRPNRITGVLERQQGQNSHIYYPAVLKAAIMF